MNPKKEEILSTFLLAFGGQLVTITTSLNAQVGFTDEDGNNVQSMPIVYEGILLDMDDQFLYLGESINEITSAIRQSCIAHIAVKEESTVLDEILDNMPNPKKDEIN